jgi:uncharacterized membrane protein
MSIYLITFAILAFLGIFDASYLTYKHYFNKKPLVCPIGEEHSCSDVTEGKYGKIFFVKNEVLGLLYYLGLFVLSFGAMFTNYTSLILVLLIVMAACGFLFSLYLLYLQKYVIKEYCFWCLISAGISILLFVNSLLFL